LKLSAWNVGLGRLLLGLFPATPAVFVYRSPLETVASLLFQPPAWLPLLDSPRWLQARFFQTVREIPADAELLPTTLFAHAWRSTVEAALALPPERILVIPYEVLVNAAETVIGRVLAHFRHSAARARLETMAGTLKAYSKDPDHQAPFNPKGEHRRPPLAPEQADEVRAITAEGLRQLDVRCRGTWPLGRQQLEG
jgi:hypothetical protein